MAASPVIPRWAAAALGVSSARLYHWRRRGWLGIGPIGRGHIFPWKDPEVVAQARWLGRLVDAGVVLDGEDVAGGFRLRAAGATYALRAEGGRWEEWKEDDPLPAGRACLLVRVNDA